MKNSQTKKETKEQKLADQIKKLLHILNASETNCTFWKVEDPDFHIMGLRPVKRMTIEVINENGFNPYEKKIEEKLFKCFKIYILDSKDKIIINEEEIKKKKEIERNGMIYIKSNDLIYIFDTVRKSS